jgi:hypothetical protein
MVDIVRLCCVTWSSRGFDSNIGRYREFARIAQLHFADLRSSIEGLALGAAPTDYERARRIELRIDWMIDKLGTEPDSPQTPPREVLSTLVDTHASIQSFLIASSLLDKTSKTAREIELLIRDGTPIEDMNGFVAARMAAQTELLKRWEMSGVHVAGIWFDVDQELALGYFLIDSILLENASLGIAQPSTT